MSENMLVDVWGRQKIMSNSPELDLTVWMCEPHSIGAGTELVPLREQNMLLTAERPPPAHIYVYSLHLLTIGVIGIDTVMYLLTIGVIGTDTITSLCSTGEYNCGFMHARQAGYRISYIPSLYLVFLLSFEKKCACSFSPNLSHSVWLLLLYPHKILPNLLSSQDVNCVTCTFAVSSATPSHGVLCNIELQIPSETRLLWGGSCSYAAGCLCEWISVCSC